VMNSSLIRPVDSGNSSGPPLSGNGVRGDPQHLCFAKTPADRGINNIAAAIPPPFCYKS
jgi:hypothetical protein